MAVEKKHVSHNFKHNKDFLHVMIHVKIYYKLSPSDNILLIHKNNYVCL